MANASTSVLNSTLTFPYIAIVLDFLGFAHSDSISTLKYLLANYSDHFFKYC